MELRRSSKWDSSVVIEVVETLQYQNFDHRDPRIRRMAAIGARRTLRGSINASHPRLKILLF